MGTTLGSHARPRKLLWVTDIPSPYRTHQFEALANELRRRGAEFEVRFMARSVPWRYWTFEPSKMRFQFQIAAGIHPQVGRMVFHLNPSIVWGVLTAPPTWLMVGGAWWLPTSVLSMAAGASRGGCRIIIGAEANRYAMSHRDGSVARARRAIMNRADAFLVPGQLARETIGEICGGTTKPFLPLPNLVDEAMYKAKVAALRPRAAELRKKWGLAASDLVLIWPARLQEDDKGILRFLEAVQSAVTDRVRILIAGEGPDRERIESWVSAHLPRSVRLLGQQPTDQMLELFAISDALLLPSIKDPNPLSVVEALWAGLPLLISDRCGNRIEAVDDGHNGWAIDPDRPEMVRTKFADLIGRTRSELDAWGERSARIASERFSTPVSVSTFVDSLEQLLVQ